MDIDLFYTFSQILFSLPAIAIAVIFIDYFRRRAVWKRKRRLGVANPGFCPSVKSVGSAFQYMQVFTRPSIVRVLEAEEEDEADEDDGGEPETLAAQLNRQLRRVRRGQPIERLVLRL